MSNDVNCAGAQRVSVRRCVKELRRFEAAINHGWWSLINEKSGG